MAFQTFDPRQQPSQFLLSGAVGTGVVVLLAVLRIYLGWAVRPGSPAAQRVPHLCCKCRGMSFNCLSLLMTMVVYASVGLFGIRERRLPPKATGRG